MFQIALADAWLQVYGGLAHLKGALPDKSGADMAAELSDHSRKKLDVKSALTGPRDTDF